MTLMEYYTDYQVVKKGRKIGLKNIKTGFDVIPAKYSDIHVTCPRYADQICFFKVKDGDKYFLCNLQGKRVTEEVDYIGEYNCGLVRFMQNGKWGFMDEQGEVIISPQYSGAEKIDFGKYKVQHDDKWGIVDNTGEIVQPEYDNIVVSARRTFGIQNKQMIRLFI